MLEKIKSLLVFKYSFIAFLAFASAIIINLSFVFSFKIIAVVVLFCLVLTYFPLNINKSFLIALPIFVLGLVTSTIYNTNFRVFELDNIINDEKAWLKGQIYKIDLKEKYGKVYLNSPVVYSDTFDTLDYNYMPNIIFSTYSSRLKDAKVGDELVAKVLLQKPKEKLFADDFSYAAYLLENRINLTAQVRGDIYITAPEHGYSLLQKIQNYRYDVANKINDYYKDKNKDVTGLSVALITGLRGYVSVELKESFKNSGLAHLMAISGMHMAFLSGIIFIIFRFGLCLIPSIALNYDSKKIAGLVTIFFALFYLLLAGATLPTIRAFCMVLMFLITMLFNRSKLALHTLCVIAMLILAFDPMAIFSASFQLSFSAVFAMLMYNHLKQFELHVDFSKPAQVFRGLVNTLNISIIAFTATMFFVASHFSYISIFSIGANVFASILMAFLVMPVLFIFFIGYVVLDIELFAQLNQFSLEKLIYLAQHFSSFETSSIYVSPFYSYIILALALLILFVIIFDFSRKYLLSGVILFIAFIIPIKLDLRPQIIQFANSSVMLREGNNFILLGDLTKREVQKVSTYYHIDKIEDNLAKNCDITGCIYDFKGKKILQMNEGFDASIEDFSLVDYVINN